MNVVLRRACRSRWLPILLNMVPGVVAFVAVLLWGQLLWPRVAWAPPQSPPAAAPAGQTDSPARLALADLAVIWERDLHQAVVDQPPPKAPEPPPDPKLALQLIGTAVEAGRQFGVFQLSAGRTVVKAVGSTVEGCEIVAIERGLARVRQGERIYELKVPWYNRLALALENRPHGH